MAERAPRLERTLRVGEVAERFGVSQTQLLAWVKAGKLRALLLPGRAGFRFREQDLRVLRLLRGQLIRQRAIDALHRGPLPFAAVEALAAGWTAPPEVEITPALKRQPEPTPEPIPEIPHKRRPEPVEAVYFIESAGLIKIGWSRDLTRRLTDLQNMSGAEMVLVGAIIGNRSTEQSLHARFDSDRRHGEWFEPSDELRRGITELLAEHGIEIAYADEAERTAAQRILWVDPDA